MQRTVDAVVFYPRLWMSRDAVHVVELPAVCDSAQSHISVRLFTHKTLVLACKTNNNREFALSSFVVLCLTAEFGKILQSTSDYYLFDRLCT